MNAVSADQQVAFERSPVLELKCYSVAIALEPDTACTKNNRILPCRPDRLHQHGVQIWPVQGVIGMTILGERSLAEVEEFPSLTRAPQSHFFAARHARDGAHPVAHSKQRQHTRRVGAQLNPGANFAQGGSLLENGHIVAIPQQSERRCVVYFPPPNTPTARRCHEVGSKIAAVLAASPNPARIAVIASGGLSHFLCEEAFDRRLIDAIRAHDGEALRSVPQQAMLSGSSEIRNWIMVRAMVDGMRCDECEYIPVYRTPVGTGIGLAFMSWR